MRFVIASAFVIHAMVSASAADLKITQFVGTVVDVRNVSIDYTNYNIIYTPDFDTLGIRARVGAGQVTIYWSNISRIEIAGRGSNGLPAAITGNDGKTTEAQLLPGSEKGLRGETDLGEFSIDLDKIKLIEVLKAR
jgi:hypothetical protein